MPSYRIQHIDDDAAHGTLTDDVAHHLVRVLHVGVGDALTVTDGAGRRWEARVVHTARDAVRVQLGTMHTMEKNPLQLTLAAALLPHERFRLVIEKAVELGATHIIPLSTERVVVRGECGEKISKWQRIADGAAEQCGTAWWPCVDAPQTLVALQGLFENYDHVFIAHPGQSPRRHDSPLTGRGLLLIGPEGGFTDAEVAHCIAAGAIPLDLGPLILRAETAVAVGLYAIGTRD